MNSEFILYLDMDGVLVDFDKAIQNLDRRGNTHVSVRDIIDFWANMEWIHGGQELWNAAQELFNGVYILSSSGTKDESKGGIVRKGKMEWLRKNMPKMPLSNIFVVNGKDEKKKFSASNAILVDDIPVTIIQWKAGGGVGILHRSKTYTDTIQQLKDIASSTRLTELVKSILK